MINSEMTISENHPVMFEQHRLSHVQFGAVFYYDVKHQAKQYQDNNAIQTGYYLRISDSNGHTKDDCSCPVVCLSDHEIYDLNRNVVVRVVNAELRIGY